MLYFTRIIHKWNRLTAVTRACTFERACTWCVLRYTETCMIQKIHARGIYRVAKREIILLQTISLYYLAWIQTPGGQLGRTASLGESARNEHTTVFGSRLLNMVLDMAQE